MKKLCLLLLAALFFVGVARVNAITEDELKDILTQTIEINGAKVHVDDATKTAIERYLNQYDVSSADADYIKGKVNTAISILKSEGQTDFKKLSQSAKNKLKQLVVDITNNTTVHATVTNGSVIVLDDQGEPFFEVDHLVKQTGSSTTLTAMVAGVSVLIVAAGACLVVKQVKEN